MTSEMTGIIHVRKTVTLHKTTLHFSLYLTINHFKQRSSRVSAEHAQALVYGQQMHIYLNDVEIVG